MRAITRPPCHSVRPLECDGSTTTFRGAGAQSLRRDQQRNLRTDPLGRRTFSPFDPIRAPDRDPGIASHNDKSTHRHSFDTPASFDRSRTAPLRPPARVGTITNRHPSRRRRVPAKRRSHPDRTGPGRNGTRTNILLAHCRHHPVHDAVSYAHQSRPSSRTMVVPRRGMADHPAERTSFVASPL
jgi:hypothetical protein